MQSSENVGGNDLVNNKYSPSAMIDEPALHTIVLLTSYRWKISNQFGIRWDTCYFYYQNIDNKLVINSSNGIYGAH